MPVCFNYLLNYSLTQPLSVTVEVSSNSTPAFSRKQEFPYTFQSIPQTGS
jgi:hypothetical protein